MVNEDKVIENYKNAMSRLETALEESGRSRKDVLVIGASKTMPLERILFVRDNTDVKIFGEKPRAGTFGKIHARRSLAFYRTVANK